MRESRTGLGWPGLGPPSPAGPGSFTEAGRVPGRPGRLSAAVVGFCVMFNLWEYIAEQLLSTQRYILESKHRDRVHRTKDEVREDMMKILGDIKLVQSALGRDRRDERDDDIVNVDIDVEPRVTYIQVPSGIVDVDGAVALSGMSLDTGLAFCSDPAAAFPSAEPQFVIAGVAGFALLVAGRARACLDRGLSARRAAASCRPAALREELAARDAAVSGFRGVLLPGLRAYAEVQHRSQRWPPLLTGVAKSVSMCTQTEAWAQMGQWARAGAYFPWYFIRGLTTGIAGAGSLFIARSTGVPQHLLIASRGVGLTLGPIAMGDLLGRAVWSGNAECAFALALAVKMATELAIPRLSSGLALCFTFFLCGWAMAVLDTLGSILVTRIHGESCSGTFARLDMAYSVGCAVAPFVVVAVHERAWPFLAVTDLVLVAVIVRKRLLRGKPRNWKAKIRGLPYEGRACGRLGSDVRLRGGAWCWDGLVLRPAPLLKVVPFNLRIAACARGAAWAEALRLLLEMRRRGPRPDIVSYNSAAHACAAATLWQRAAGILWTLRRGGGPAPDAATFAAVVKGLGKGAVWQRAVAVLADMGRARVRQDTLSFVSAIDACGSAACWPAGIALLGEMLRCGLPLGIHALSAVATACVRGARWQGGLALLHGAAAAGLRLDEVAIGAGLQACAAGARWDVGLSLLERASRQAVRQGAPLLEAAVAACAAGGQWARALALHGRHGAPTAVGCNHALTACERGRQWQACLLLLREMPRARLAADAASFVAAARGAAAAPWPLALALLSEARARGLALGSFGALAAVGACASGGQ
ncbi:unnamed protein product, partial [Prorocentrum cordatum]